MRRRLATAAVLAATVAITGCGIGAGSQERGGGADLAITRDSGADQLKNRTVSTVRQGDTVMRFLQGSAKVKTRYGGGFVQSIDGLAGTGRGGSRDWFYYVNGILADKGAAEYKLRGGDKVQWDYRYWKTVPDVKAIVGGFPEPFVNGLDGKKFPVRVECQDVGSDPCSQVKDRLDAEGVTASGAALGTQGTQNVARIVVGEWPRIRDLPTVRALEQGPGRSGVFARYDASGRRLAVLDDHARTVRTEGPGAGLVAAMRPTDMTLVWVVTGGDAAGLKRAAAAFGGRTLKDAFAVVAGPGRTTGVPVKGTG